MSTRDVEMTPTPRPIGFTTPSPPSSVYVRTPEEVYTVRSYLMKWVPLELSDAIMDEAEYWPTIVCKANASAQALWYVLEVHNNCFCCVYTPRLPNWEESYESVKIKEVCFKMTSSDQGWTTDPGPFRTEYDGSFTWFEAVVTRDFEDNPAARQSSPARDIGSRIQQSVRRGLVNQNGDTDTIASNWEIQRNFRASPFYRTHRVVWSSKDGAADDPEARKYDAKTGAYRGAGFVQALLPGDRIGIIMKAQKQAWQNITESASIEIIYSM